MVGNNQLQTPNEHTPIFSTLPACFFCRFHTPCSGFKNDGQKLILALFLTAFNTPSEHTRRGSFHRPVAIHLAHSVGVISHKVCPLRGSSIESGGVCSQRLFTLSVHSDTTPFGRAHNFFLKIFRHSRKKRLLCNGNYQLTFIKNTYKRMKKNILSLAVIVAALTFALPSQAQIKFGVKAGLNLNSVDLKDPVNNVSSKDKTGFFAGVTADVTIPLAGLGADIALLYDNKVVGVAAADGTESNKTLHNIAVPINLKYTLGFSSLVSVYAATGPQFSWNVGDRSWKPATIDEDWELKKSEFSWNVGAGVTALKHIRVGYNYNIGIGKTAETTVLSTAGKAVKGKLKNNTHQISLTYFF